MVPRPTRKSLKDSFRHKRLTPTLRVSSIHLVELNGPIGPYLDSSFVGLVDCGPEMNNTDPYLDLMSNSGDWGTDTIMKNPKSPRCIGYGIWVREFVTRSYTSKYIVFILVSPTFLARNKKSGFFRFPSGKPYLWRQYPSVVLGPRKSKERTGGLTLGNEVPVSYRQDGGPEPKRKTYPSTFLLFSCFRYPIDSGKNSQYDVERVFGMDHLRTYVEHPFLTQCSTRIWMDVPIDPFKL